MMLGTNAVMPQRAVDAWRSARVAIPAGWSARGMGCGCGCSGTAGCGCGCHGVGSGPSDILSGATNWLTPTELPTSAGTVFASGNPWAIAGFLAVPVLGFMLLRGVFSGGGGRRR